MLKTKQKNKFQKVLAMIFIILTLFSTTQPIFAVTSSGTGKWVSGQWDSGVYTTDNKGSVGILLRRLVNYTTGEKLTVFCVEHGVDSPTGTIETGEHSIPTDPKMREACKIAYFGWYSKYGDYVIDGGIMAESLKDRKMNYVFTQQMIWETLGQSNATFKDSSIQSQYVLFKAEINEKIANMKKQPSFVNETITLEVGETKTITDSNNVLKDYVSFDKTVDGIRITHTKGQNTLSITVDETCTKETYKITESTMKSWGIIKEETADKDTTVFFTFREGVQNQLYALNYNDPVTMLLDLKIDQYGRLELSKLNTNGDLVDGAIFTVTGENGYNQEVTVTNGKIILEKLKKGTYYIKEKSSPNGYLLNTETYTATIKPNQTTKQAIVNDEPTGNLIIEKTDGDTGNKNRIDGKSHHGDATLKGTVYTLYAKEKITNVAGTVTYFEKDEQIATFTFNEYGVASIKITNSSTPAEISVSGNMLKGLPMGKYYAKETVVATGYMQDTNVYDYTFSYKDMNTKTIEIAGTVKNTVQKAPFEVIKVTTNDNTTAETVAGAEFTAILSKYVDYYGSFNEALKHLDEYAEDEYSIFKTGADGHGVSGLLAYGEYTVNETYTPSAEIETVEQFYVNIDRDSKTPIKELVENDLPFEAYIKLQKQDKDTGKFVTYSNATFELYKLNEDTKKWEQVKCKVGNQYFTSWTTDKEGIARTENKLEAGHYKLTEIKIPTGFIELDEELTFDVNNRNKTLEYDEDYDAWNTVTAKNEQPTGTLKLNKKVNLRENVDNTMIKDIDFTQISFELVAKENVIDYADGSIIYEKGKVVGKYNLKTDGTLEVDNLPMGKYYLKELTTIDGAVLDQTEYEVIFEQTDTKIKEYTVNLNIENETTCVEISKVDITGEKELIGAELSIIDEDNEVIDSWTSTEKAHKIEGLKVGKTYTLKEEIAPNGYVRATNIKFTVENTAEIQKITMIDKVVEMTKEDIGGNEIEGAELKVVDKDGKIVDSWTSTKEPHRINGLVEGESYTLYEDYAPDGYVISNEITFTVTTEKETQKVVMIDKTVEIIKTDLITGEEIEGAKLQVVDEDGNVIDEWTSTKEAHRVTGLEENKNYKLIEKIAPYGYEITEEISFTVTEDKQTQKIEMKDMPILTNIRVIKIDSQTKEIINEKFTFGIYEDAECTKLIEEIKSNKEDGFVTFEDLRYGIFFIKELKSPKGYELSNRIAKVEINDKGVFIDDIEIQEDNEAYSFEFENQKIETPKTRR